MFHYLNKAVISLEITFPRSHNLRGIHWIQTKKTHFFLSVSLSSLPSVFKSLNSQIFLFKNFSLGLTHLHENTLDPFSNYYSDIKSKHRFPFIEKKPHKPQHISHTFADRTNVNLAHIVLLDNTSYNINTNDINFQCHHSPCLVCSKIWWRCFPLKTCLT